MQTITDIFRINFSPATAVLSLEERVNQLEELIVIQNRRIYALEEQLIRQSQPSPPPPPTDTQLNRKME